MVAALRAGLAVVMLVGFYVVALAMLGGSIALLIWVAGVANAGVALKLTLPLFLATVGAVGYGLYKALFSKPEPMPGLTVGPDRAPALWNMVHDLARVVGTRVPDEIRIIPDVNAAVAEHSRMLGLIPGRRYMYIGLPLLQVMSLSQLRSVLAHELGHYSGSHTRLGAVAYRGHVAMAETLSRIGPYNVAGWVFKGYGMLYTMADSAVTRRQEYEADRASVQVAGRAAAAGTLRELPILVAAWNFYFRVYLKPGWEAGFAPDDVFGGFARMVAARAEELEKLRAEDPEPEEQSRWDTHPPIPDRIAAIGAMPESPVPYDGRPAIHLLPDPHAAGLRMQEMMVEVGDRTVLPWPRFTHATVVAGVQRSADRVFRVIARKTGVAQPTLGTVFDLIAGGRLGEVAEEFFPNATRREAGPLFAEILESLMELAAARSGVAGWRHSWSGPAEFVDSTGAPASFAETAKLAVGRGGLDEAYRRLVSSGVDINAAGLVERTASAIGGKLIAALANVKVDDVEYDLLVLSNGLVLVPDPGKADQGKRRLIALIQSAPALELARRHRFLPYEELASATITKPVPLHATLVLHDGRRIDLKEKMASEFATKDSRDVLIRALRSIED